MYHPDGTVVRGRTTSSAFTVKGEVKLSTDLVVMEVVVDSKMFKNEPDGGKAKGYAVDVRARKRIQLALHKQGLDAVPLSELGSCLAPAVASSSPNFPTSTSMPASTNSSTTTAVDTDATVDLPFIYTLYTMPSSPLHSSGLSAESPSRHLLRLTLPTAQYRVSNVKDPLTGEMRSAPPKPQWLLEMEKEGGGIVVELVVHPAETAVSERGMESNGSVLINGKEVPIIGEKESLTTLGREELLDDRTARMGVLSRWVPLFGFKVWVGEFTYRLVAFIDMLPFEHTVFSSFRLYGCTKAVCLSFD